jgi:hypothetical protein
MLLLAVSYGLFVSATLVRGFTNSVNVDGDALTARYYTRDYNDPPSGPSGQAFGDTDFTSNSRHFGHDEDDLDLSLWPLEEDELYHLVKRGEKNPTKPAALPQKSAPVSHGLFSEDTWSALVGAMSKSNAKPEANIWYYFKEVSGGVPTIAFAHIGSDGKSIEHAGYLFVDAEKDNPGAPEYVWEGTTIANGETLTFLGKFHPQLQGEPAWMQVLVFCKFLCLSLGLLISH